MSESKVLHVFNDQKKFSKPYFEFLKAKGIDLTSHTLFHYGKKDGDYQAFGMPYVFSSLFSIPKHIKLFQLMREHQKVIIHSLASPWLLIFLYLFPRLNKKVYWVIWGKDLYYYKLLNKRYFYHDIYEFFRRKVFKGIPFIVPIIMEDYELAKKWYGVSGSAIECNLLYPNSVDLTGEVTEDRKPNRKNYNIIVGNSASETNNHIEAFLCLSRHLKSINKLYCPLSYGGNKKYTQSVLDKGYELFGEKFRPLIEFLPYENYMELMRSIDIGYYENNRQEGLGNILSLLNYGKTIYIRSDITSWRFFQRNNIRLLDTKNLKVEELTKLDENTIAENREKMRALFNENKSLEVWENIFSMEIK